MTSNWVMADELRNQIEKLGWEILDTNSGPMSRKLSK
jgi:cysteinyl-tRNA synthetase